VPKTYADLVREAIAIAGEITPSELSPKMGSVVLIDCR